MNRILNPFVSKYRTGLFTEKEVGRIDAIISFCAGLVCLPAIPDFPHPRTFGIALLVLTVISVFVYWYERLWFRRMISRKKNLFLRTIVEGMFFGALIGILSVFLPVSQPVLLYDTEPATYLILMLFWSFVFICITTALYCINLLLLKNRKRLNL